MAEGEEAPELTALDDNMDIIKSTIQTDLNWFSDKLIKKRFIRRPKASSINGLLGVPQDEKARQFMEEVYNFIDRSDDKTKWFNEFVDIFSHNAAYKELVKKLKDSVDSSCQSDGVGAGRGQVGSDGRSNSDGVDNQEDMCYTDWFELDSSYEAAEAFVRDEKHIWERKELQVFFMNKIPPWDNNRGGYISKEEILEIANEWHNCGTTVVPKFVECAAKELSDIRVEFTAIGNPRSLVGTDAISVVKDKPTMWLKLAPTQMDNPIPKRYKRTIRHEFGHALGLQHEHQNPDSELMYDHNKLKEYLKVRYPRCSDNEIEERIRIQWAKIKSSCYRSTEHDEHSVMHYVVPRAARARGYKGPTQLPLVLSPKDKKFIVELYSRGNVKEEEDEEKMDFDPARKNEGVIRAEGSGESDERPSSNSTSGAGKDAGVKKSNIHKKDDLDNLSDPVFDGTVSNGLLIYLKYNDDGEDKVLRIKKSIATKWAQLASLLGFSNDEITIIKQSHFFQSQECSDQMLTDWMRKDLDCNWRKLIKKMRAVELSSAEELAKALKNQVLEDI